MSNLRQIGIALAMFTDDHNGQPPPQVSSRNGGSLELIGSNSPALHFQTLSNYLRNWRVFHCPADRAKQPLTGPSAVTDHNLSYFISVDATRKMIDAFQGGDRNLQVAGQPVKPGLFILTTNTALGWTREMHTKQAGRQCGIILFGDTHVQALQADLPAAVRRQCLAANRLAVP